MFFWHMVFLNPQLGGPSSSSFIWVLQKLGGPLLTVRCHRMSEDGQLLARPKQQKHQDSQKAVDVKVMGEAEDFLLGVWGIRLNVYGKHNHITS